MYLFMIQLLYVMSQFMLIDISVWML